MKKLYSIILTSFASELANLFVQQTHAQTPYYSFSQYTSTYANLTSPISLNNGNLWDFSIPTAYYPLNVSPLLSNFPVFGDYNYELRLCGGTAQFYNSGSQQIYYMNGFGLFYPDGMKDKGTSTSLSPISYQVSGTTPNRILKIEWKNAGPAAASADFINVQLWLYETSNIIEVHYGSSSITNACTTQLSVGIGHTYVPNSNMIEDDFLENGPSNPILSMNANAFYGIPTNGTVYKFTVAAAGVAEINLDDLISVYPNPSNGKFTLSSEITKGEISVYNVEGEKVYSSTIQPSNHSTIDLSSHPNGIYFINIKTENGIANKKLIINK